MSDLRIRVDASEVTAALDQLDKKGNRQAVQAATKAAGKYLKPRVKAGAPKGRTGNLRARVGYRTKKSRRDPGSYYTVTRSFAPHHHLVVEGTRRRSTRSGANRGVMPANDYVSRVADASEGEALRIAEAELIRKLGLD